LVDEGYNVWIGNNRGTEYSQRHKIYDASDNGTARDYWDFTWADMQYDVKANIEAIKEVTDEEKIIYLGYSQGTIQMHYALAHDEEHWFKDNLHKIV
jgi:pimeloyl-ACP methyl ester carboxylesterase